jgi:adenine-specific DNA-methyltransferase
MTEKTNKYSHYTREDLVRLLQERDQKPRFGLVWERNEIDHDHSINSDFVALDSIVELSNGQAPYRNLLIEGDNFDALRYLRMTHAGQVKCIYIDPPYNTGNKDFIYNDRFVDKDDAYKHSKWLEYMYRRLHLARELLRPDGVIFVSIDDVEACHLKLLMDKIFGDNLFIGQLVWKSRQNKDNRTKNGASIDHEYVLVYGRTLRGEERNQEQFKNPDNDYRGEWTSGNMVGLADERARPNLHYDLIDPQTGINYGRPAKGWRFDRKRMMELINDNRIIWPSSDKGRPRVKVFLSEMKSDYTGYSSLIGQDTYTYHGTRELDDIFGQSPFPFPKPSNLIVELLEQANCEKNDIIVDFFGGSGTTAHAVQKLNEQDGGTRRFIIVSSTEASTENPDKSVCRDICAKRIAAIQNGYKDKNNEQIEGLGGDFAYCRTRRIPTHTVFSTIQHEQIWTALQLINTQTLTHYDATAPLQQMDYEKNGIAHGIIYLPNAGDVALQALQNIIQDDAKTVIVYAWQPAMAQQVLNNPSITVEPIPQYLVALFNAGARN